MTRALFDLKLIFDMRGFWADERIDGGIWPSDSPMYRVAKWFERGFLLNADCVVSLTQAGVDAMRAFDYLQGRMPWFEVITTCADLELFRPSSASQAATDDRVFTLGYVGSAGVWYMFDETLRCFALLRRRVPGARLRILNRGEHEYIRSRIAALGIDSAAVTLETTDHEGVAAAMREMDATIFFIKPVFSKTASAPTKLGEFLGSGVPCLGNRGVGDMADVLESEGVGVALADFEEGAMAEAVDRLLNLTRMPDIRARCRAAAERHFSLDVGVSRYRAIYDRLLRGDA